jgi:hypothetical protein
MAAPLTPKQRKQEISRWLAELRKPKGDVYVAAQKLGELKAKEAVNDLIRIVNTYGTPQHSVEAIRECVGALGDIGDMKALRPLLEMARKVKKASSFQGDWLAIAIRRIGGNRAREALEEIANDDELQDLLRQSAQDQLNQLGADAELESGSVVGEVSEPAEEVGEVSVAAEEPEKKEPERLPPAVESTIAAAWLTLGLGLLGLAALWPLAIEAAPGLTGVNDPRALTQLGWMTFGGLAGFAVLAGLVVSFMMSRQKRNGLRFLRMGLMLGLVIGLVLAVGIVGMTMQSNPNALLGPTPFLSGLLMTLVVLLPVGMGILSLSFAGSRTVRDFFTPPAPPTPAPIYSVPAPVDVGEVSAPAPSAPYEEPGPRATDLEPPPSPPVPPPEQPPIGGAEELEALFQEGEAQPAAAPEEGIAATDETRITHVVPGGGKETMMQPSDQPGPDALDAIFDAELEKAPQQQEMAETVAFEPTAGEEGIAPPSAPATQPGTGVSDSIFDEDLPPQGESGLLPPEEPPAQQPPQGEEEGLAPKD